MERTYLLERAAHARSVAVAKGRQVGRPVTVTPAQVAYAEKLRQAGDTIAQIVAKTGITRTTLYRHLPPRPAPLLTATAPAEQIDRRPSDDRPADVSCGGSITADVPVTGPSAGRSAQRLPVGWSGQDLLEAVDWPDTYRPACSVCQSPISGLRERYARRGGVRQLVVVALAWPCGCAVDEHAAALQAGAPAQDAPQIDAPVL